MTCCLMQRNVSFKVGKVMFLGHHLLTAGIKPSPNKIADLKNFRAPETKEELKSGVRGSLGANCERQTEIDRIRQQKSDDARRRKKR